VSAEPPTTGYTVRDLAKRYRVGEDKVRAWIIRGELAAINTAAALCGRPRFVVPPEALAAFECRRSAAPPPPPSRRRKRTVLVDYSPIETRAAVAGDQPGRRRCAETSYCEYTQFHRPKQPR
jgi:hypothetical protein